jgi:glucose/arabinose dehydrogenase
MLMMLVQLFNIPGEVLMRWTESSIMVLLVLFFSSVSPAAEMSWPVPALGRKITSVEKPTSITNARDGSKRLFITEQPGRIVIVRDNAQLKEPFLDIRGRVGCCGERGLLSVVFPQGFQKKNYFYVNYTNRSGDTVVARFRTTKNPDQADPASEEKLLMVKQPFANHNGGQLAFGPDGYLYIGMGDGGSAGDPFRNGQKLDTLLGKMLRIDVESNIKPYGVPPSNPYVGKKGVLPEIWSLGLRNPWRFSFDRKTGDLFIADVGQNKYEEVNVQPASSKGGENYGWNIMEGLHCFRAKACDTSGLVMPVAEYDHDAGCSVTGGLVYRGTLFPSFDGIYFYGDYCSGRIWGIRRSGEQWIAKELVKSGISISAFGDDEAGELYVADYGGGGIFRIESREAGR